MAELSEKQKMGLKVIDEMSGGQVSKLTMDVIDQGGFGAPLAKISLDLAFADVWAREGMERKSRSLIVLGILVGLRQWDEFRHHVRIGLNNGLTVSDIEEVLVTVIAYAGLPAASSALMNARSILQELGKI